MSNYNEIFRQLIANGVKAAESTSAPGEKALAYAELAKAVAMAMTTKPTNYSAAEPETSVAAIAAEKTDSVNGKESLKRTASKAKKEPEPTVAVEPEVTATEVELHPGLPTYSETIEEPEIDDSWTEELLEEKAEQINIINELIETYGPDAMDKYMTQFSQGVLTTCDEISPMNIDAFILFVRTVNSERTSA